MFAILPGLGVSTSEFHVSQALAEPSQQRPIPRPWAREGGETRARYRMT